MCALTVAPPSSPDPRNNPSWAARAATLRVKRSPDARVVSLSFYDLHVSADDMTTVGEALARCSPDDMLRAVMRYEAGWRIPVDTIGSRAQHMLMGKIATALETMRSLGDAATELAPSKEGIVGPLFRFAPAEGGAGLEHRVEAAVFSMNDAAVIEGCLANGAERVCTWDALRALRCEAEGSSVPSGVDPETLHRSHMLLSRMPWERVLALPLWLPNDLSEDERWAILARAFWSMTYRGFMQNEGQRGSQNVRVGPEERRPLRTEVAPWPVDPVLAVLDHNCWIDTLETWNALFAVISPSETRP